MLFLSFGYLATHHRVGVSLVLVAKSLFQDGWSNCYSLQGYMRAPVLWYLCEYLAFLVLLIVVILIGICYNHCGFSVYIPDKSWCRVSFVAYQLCGHPLLQKVPFLWSDAFWWEEIFNSNKVQFINSFSFVVKAFSVCLTGQCPVLPTTRSWSHLSVFF